MLQLTAADLAEIKRLLRPDNEYNKYYNRYLLCRTQRYFCFWCNQPMLSHVSVRADATQKGKRATLEHLDARLDADIIKQLDGLRLVAAHMKCNHARSVEQGVIRQRELGLLP